MPLSITLIVLLLPPFAFWLFTRIILFMLARKANAGQFLEQQVADIVEELGISSMAINHLTAGTDSTGLVQALEPMIEQHVDHFLSHKIKDSFPMLFGMLGEKTIGKFKVAFMEEVQLLLPTVLQQYSDQFSKHLSTKNIADLILSTVDGKAFVSKVTRRIQPNILRLQLLAIIYGFLIGVIQVLTLWLILHY